MKDQIEKEKGAGGGTKSEVILAKKEAPC